MRDRSQQRRDCLDLQEDKFVSLPFLDVIEKGCDFPVDLYLMGP
jgi:hypothetical protein